MAGKRRKQRGRRERIWSASERMPDGEWHIVWVCERLDDCFLDAHRHEDTRTWTVECDKANGILSFHAPATEQSAEWRIDWQILTPPGGIADWELGISSAGSEEVEDDPDAR